MDNKDSILILGAGIYQVPLIKKAQELGLRAVITSIPGNYPGFAAADTDYEPTGWVLKAYGNSVALYNGDEIKAIYGEVELDTLPPEDVRMLESGIAFPTRAEAETAIEDYDG